MARYSRLLIDPNRGEDDPTLVRQIYDGAIIPGNYPLFAPELQQRIRHISGRFALRWKRLGQNREDDGLSQLDLVDPFVSRPAWEIDRVLGMSVCFGIGITGIPQAL